MDEEERDKVGTEPARKLFEQAGGWPLLNKEEEKKAEDERCDNDKKDVYYYCANNGIFCMYLGPRGTSSRRS